MKPFKCKNNDCLNKVKWQGQLCMSCVVSTGYARNPTLQQGIHNSFYGKHHTKIHNKKLSKKLLGKINIKHGRRSKLYKIYCKDCHKRINSYKAVRCYSCAALYRFKDSRNHPNYIDGRNLTTYPSTFNKHLKQSILKRDKHICQWCFKDGNSVHHIDYDKNHNRKTNLVTLCLSCNVKVNYCRIKAIVYFKKYITGLVA